MHQKIFYIFVSGYGRTLDVDSDNHALNKNGRDTACMWQIKSSEKERIEKKKITSNVN